MPATGTIIFTTVDGGYQGENAIIDNTSTFYLDVGKSSAYAAVEIYDGGPILSSYGTVNGISVIIEDAYGQLAGGSNPNTFNTKLHHESSGAFTSPILTSNITGTAQNLEIGGPTNTWGKTWSQNDISNLRVKLCDPIEPNGGGIALIATFVYVIVHFTLLTPSFLQLSSGKIKLSSGKLVL